MNRAGGLMHNKYVVVVVVVVIIVVVVVVVEYAHIGSYDCLGCNIDTNKSKICKQRNDVLTHVLET
ncbi:hypothetical protein ACF0H5_001526 [Mactra antiquata]